MKKLFIIPLATICFVGYSQSVITTQKQDEMNLQKARIEALDAQYKSQTNQLALQYTMNRNAMLRQLEKTNSVPTISRQPASITPSN